MFSFIKEKCSLCVCVENVQAENFSVLQITDILSASVVLLNTASTRSVLKTPQHLNTFIYSHIASNIW